MAMKQRYLQCEHLSCRKGLGLCLQVWIPSWNEPGYSLHLGLDGLPKLFNGSTFRHGSKRSSPYHFADGGAPSDHEQPKLLHREVVSGGIGYLTDRVV